MNLLLETVEWVDGMSTFAQILAITIAIILVISIICTMTFAIVTLVKVRKAKAAQERELEKLNDVATKKEDEADGKTQSPRKKEFCEYCWSRLNSKGVCPNCGAAADWSNQK